MSMWSEIRSLATAWHNELLQGAHGLAPAEVLLEGARLATGIKLIARAPDDALLDGADGLYDREDNRIFYSSALGEEDARFTIAHEFAHHRLHDTHAPCSSTDVDVATPAEPETSVVGETDAYSPKERAEAQANLFAREFLLPRAELKSRWSQGDCDAKKIAKEVGLALPLVLQQLADAILLPDDPETEAKGPPPAPDPSQLRAATAGVGPHQVRAGPGTGKTRTLVARIKWLVDKKEDPAGIVALTYSNESAADLAARLRLEIGDAAASVWSGTFHAFGLELLRKYGEAIGLPINPKLYDRSDQLFLLEELLPSLNLQHYLDLRDPLRTLKAVVGAISRAKDELATPDDYAALAAAMEKDLAQAEAAAKAAEVAHIYHVYQQALIERGGVDFGDLIMRAHELLDTNPEIKAEVRSKAKHILVDEYQDMNRASALFLKLLVTPGQGPWVVGDARQSIYRFRGASPLNMTAFADDFPGAKYTDLEVNYRSGGKIVRTFSAFGASMGAGVLPPMPRLKAHKGEEAGAVDYEIGATFEAEAEGIARTIRSTLDDGGTYRDHVVLARSHTTLARLGDHFERAGIPSLYFGDFFERDEIRDSLSLLSVASEWEGLGILRIGQAPPYAVPVADIVVLSNWRREEKLTMSKALRRLDQIEGLSTKGRDGLARLAIDLADVDWVTTPHALILDHLFMRGRVREGILAATGVAGQKARLAVYQLLQVAFDFRAAPGADPKRAFLDHVRRLEILDEEKEFRHMPAAAAGIDAVRLMTVHSSKGLEFPHVHIAALGGRYFPAPNRYNPCPPPQGLIPDDPLMGREAEEEGLFFVALSRAENRLSLTRADRYGRQSSNPSKLLKPIASHLPRPISGSPSWTDEGAREREFPALEPICPIPDEVSIRALETYEDCPRRYYYEYGLGLGGWAKVSPYIGLVSTVRATLAWARKAPDDEARADGWRREFELHWQNIGPAEGPLAEVYRQSGMAMMQRAIELTAGPAHPVERNMVISGKKVAARADHIVERDGGLTVQRLKAAPLAKTEKSKTRYGALVAMVQSDHPGIAIAFEHVSLMDGERKPGTIKADASISALEAALGGIRKGEFPPIPDQRRCPECSYYFACPAEGVLRSPAV